jgi:hypothetical protein
MSANNFAQPMSQQSVRTKYQRASVTTARALAMAMIAVAAWAVSPAAFAEGWNFSITGFGKGIVGSGNVITQPRVVEPFTAILVKGAADVTIRQTGKSAVEVRADDNIAPLVTTEVKSGVLIIGMKDRISLRSKNKIVVNADVADLTAISIKGSGDVSVPALKAGALKISISGSGDVRSSELAATTLNVQVSGSGDVAIDRLNANELIVEIEGSGDFRAEGSALTQRFSVDGSGDIRASKLQGKDVRVAIAGSGDAAVWATGTLNASVAGSGDIRYTGDAAVEKNVRGSGSISKR